MEGMPTTRRGPSDELEPPPELYKQARRYAQFLNLIISIPIEAMSRTSDVKVRHNGLGYVCTLTPRLFHRGRITYTNKVADQTQLSNNKRMHKYDTPRNDEHTRLWSSQCSAISTSRPDLNRLPRRQPRH